MKPLKKHFLKEYNFRNSYPGMINTKRYSNASDETVANAFIKRFLTYPDKVNGRVIIVDDIMFIITLNKNNDIFYVQLMGNCPRNGERTLSKKCYHDWEIGKMIHSFQPSDSHACKL